MGGGEHHRYVNLSFARVTQGFAKADVRQSISKGIDRNGRQEKHNGQGRDQEEGGGGKPGVPV